MKKILFISTAKLTSISIGLLLAVFCTIGMSFTPADEGDIVEPNDSTTLASRPGPRRAHWDNSSTNSCTGAVTHKYNSTVDKANTNVQTRGNGYVTISTSETANVTAPSSGNPRTVTSSAATSGSTATISWNSGLATETNASSPTYTSEQITVAHKKTFTISATPISDDYRFAGWGTTTSESSIDNYDNPREIVSDMKITGYTSGSKGNPDYSSTAYSETYYAFFKLRVPANITLKVPTNGTITYSYESYPATTLTSEKVVTTKCDLALVATPDAGYVFFGWYTMEGSTENFISTSENYTRAYPDDITIYAKFIPSNQAIFNVKGTEQYYYDLGRACSEAASSSSKIVYPIADGTVPAGNYTIPAGVTLLIPYNSANNTQTKPALVTAESALTIYRKLTLLDGANITVNGNICVGGQQTCMGGGKPSGYVTGACGVIDMSLGGHIELNNNSCFYAWGFVKGQDMDQGNNTVGVGTITANNGAKVYENFAVGDWRGGSACLDIQGSNFFPFQSYFIQNIEVPLTVNYGAVDNCYASVSGGGQNLQLPATMIGTTDALFKLASGGVVRKWYDATTDLMCFELSGTANLDAVVVKGLPVIGNISSSDYYLPISSNMHIILTNSNVTISKPMTVQPGAKIEVKSDANITISSNVFLYDKEEWGAYAGPSYYFHNYGNTYGILTTHKNRGNGKSKDLLDDAQIIVDGQLNITGKLYSTASGADVMGNGGGHAIFSALPSSSTTIAAFTGNGDAVSGGVTVNTANLHNEDESYTKAIASTTFYNEHGRWFKSGNQNENTDHTYNFTYIASGAVSGTGGTDVSPNTHNAVYAPDKTGLTAGMKWCNVTQDGTCPAIYNATQNLNGTAAANIRYTYQSSDWLQLLKTETEGVYGGSDNSLYALDGCTITSLGSVDENCLYTIEGVKKALVDGHFVALEKNTNDEAFHNTANTEEYYISFAGCTWHTAAKYAGEEKTYIVEGGIYIWYNNDWLLVEREDPFFFDYNDQNVKRYYEYENDEWVLADPKVRVTDAIETRDFFFLPEAFAIAKGKKNATITILKDITDTTTPLSFTQANTTCTLDLNGHTVNLTITGSGTTGVNMIKIDASGSTFTITDNSAEKDGKLILKQGITTATATKRWYGIVLANGSLALNAGEVQAINDFTYTSTKNTGMISAIYIAAGKTFTMNGGSIYAESPYYPRAIEIAGSASAKATVTLNAGTITANATSVTNAMGIYTVGGTTTIKEGVTINATTKTTSAYGIFVDASTSNYWGTVNMTGGTINSTATTTTALGAYVNGTYSFNNTTPNTIKGTYRGVLNITGGTFNVITNGTTTAYGIQTRGTTTITGGTFNVTPKTTTAYGLLVQDGTTTISGTPTFTIKGTTTAYGIYANGATPEDKTGRPYNPNVIVNGGTFDVTTTTGDVAYGVYAGAGTRVITSTASGYYPGIYSSIGTVTVNGGTFNVTAKTYNAIGVYVYRVAAYESGTNTAHVFRGVANIAGGTFTVRDLTHKTTTGACDGVRSYGTLNITGGSFDVAASASTAKNATYVYGVNVYDGTATISGTPEFTVSAYGTAFGAVANGATPDKATGLPCEADLTIDGGTFNVNTTTSTTAYGVYAAGPAPRVITSTDAGYYPGTYYSKPVATVNGGTFNVKAKTTTAIGAYCGRGVLYDQEVLEPHTVELENFGELNIKGGTFNVSTLGTTTADGVRSFGTTNITGGTFNVTPKTTTATAIRTYAGKTTITGNPHFTVKGTTTVYGLNAGCEAPNAKSGLTYNGEIECNGGTFDLETKTGATCYGVYAYAGSVKITTLHSADANYFAGNYASAGTIVVNDGIFNVKAKTTGAYGVVVPATVTQSGATGYPTATATAKCDINGGKFIVEGTETFAVYKKAAKADFKISGGYWGGDGVNDNLAYYAVSPNKVLTLREVHALYADGYRYTIGEGGTVIWKNGTTTLLSEVYLKGETPAFTGAAPTKETDAQYIYTFSGWTPAIKPMENSDITYSATFTPTLRQYDVTFNLQGHGASIAKQTLDYGSFVSKPTDPVTTDYTFEGWYKESECVNEWNFETDVVTGATELFAKWASDNAGTKLDIVEWTSNGNETGTLTLNLNGIPAAGWPYVINEVPYDKTDRADDRTLSIPYSGSADTKLTITVKDKYNNTYSRYKYIIPHVYGETAELAETNSPARVIVVNSGTLTVKGNVTVNAIYVAPGAELKVKNGVTLTVDSLMLRTTPWEAAILDNQGTIISSKTYYTRKVADNSKYYQFAIPLASDVKNVRLSNNSKCTYNTSWMLKSYDEESRAKNGAVNKETISNWKLLEPNGEGQATILGSVGYEMFSNTPYYREYYFPVALPETEATEVGVSYHSGEAGPNHAGWNALCSPLMRKYPQAHGEPDERLKISLLNPDGTYQQTAPDIIYPAVPFYYQATHNGTISFNGDAMIFSAPRRAWNAYVPTQWMQLAIRNLKGDKLDETSIYAHPEKFAPEYETGYDVAKQSLTGGKALIYSELPCGKLAFAAVPDSLAENRIPITVNANDEGEFLFSLMENNYLGRLQHVLLHDMQNGFVTDLLERDYSAKLNAGTNAGRFYIQCVFAAEAPAVTTGVNSIESNDDAPQKIMYKNKVYIIYQGRVYDMTGRQCELR